LYTPLMASEQSRVASGGAGNEDPEENANDYDPGWRDEQHSYTRVYSMVRLMQDNFSINYVYTGSFRWPPQNAKRRAEPRA